MACTILWTGTPASAHSTRNWQVAGALTQSAEQLPAGFLKELIYDSNNNRLYTVMSENGASAYTTIGDSTKPFNHWAYLDSKLSGFSHIPTSNDAFVSTDGKAIYIATLGGLSYSLNNGDAWQTANSRLTPNFGPDNETRKVLVANNTIYVGTESGVSIFKNNAWTHYGASAMHNSNPRVNDLKFRDGLLLVATDGGLSIFDGNHWYTTTSFLSHSWEQIQNITLSYNRSEPIHVGTTEGLYGCTISSDKTAQCSKIDLSSARMAVNASGYPLLVGTSVREFIKTSSFTTWQAPTELSNKNINVTQFLSDSNKQVYAFLAGTNNGFYISSNFGHNWNFIANTSDGLSHQITSFAYDSHQGLLFVGDRLGNIAVFTVGDGGTLTYTGITDTTSESTAPASFKSPAVLNLSIEKTALGNKILAGTTSSLNLYTSVTNSWSSMDSNPVYASTFYQEAMFYSSEDGVEKTSTIGESTSNGLTGHFVYNLIKSGKHLFAATNKGLFQYQDATTWQPMLGSSTDPTITAYSDGALIIAGTADGIYYQMGDGATLHNDLDHAFVYAIRSNADQSIIYVASSKG